MNEREQTTMNRVHSEHKLQPVSKSCESSDVFRTITGTKGVEWTAADAGTWDETRGGPHRQSPTERKPAACAMSIGVSEGSAAANSGQRNGRPAAIFPHCCQLQVLYLAYSLVFHSLHTFWPHVFIIIIFFFVCAETQFRPAGWGWPSAFHWLPIHFFLPCEFAASQDVVNRLEIESLIQWKQWKRGVRLLSMDCVSTDRPPSNKFTHANCRRLFLENKKCQNRQRLRLHFAQHPMNASPPSWNLRESKNIFWLLSLSDRLQRKSTSQFGPLSTNGKFCLILRDLPLPSMNRPANTGAWFVDCQQTSFFPQMFGWNSPNQRVSGGSGRPFVFVAVQYEMLRPAALIGPCGQF